MKYLTSLLFLFLTSWMVLVAGKGTDVTKPGTCVGGSSTSKIKVSEENGGLEVEFEVDMNKPKPRRVWTVIIKKNGKQVYKRNHRTNAASGSFDARAVIPGGVTGRITAQATSLGTSEVCKASARYP